MNSSVQELGSVPKPNVMAVREKIKNLLNEDLKLINSNPKKYEQERNKADEIVYNRDIFEKETAHHLLTRSFKRRLKKGFSSLLESHDRFLDLEILLRSNPRYF